MASIHLLQPLHSLSSTILFFSQPNYLFSSSLKPNNSKRLNLSKSLTLTFSLTESSDSPQPLETSSKSLFVQLSKCFDLPSDYFQQLPADLRLDLNDAAFDLSNGPIIDECGQELGETLLNLSRAWEQADTSTSHSLVKKLPELESSLTDGARSAFGRRLISAGKRFKGMGQYGQGDLQKIAKAMITTGEVLSASTSSVSGSNESKSDTRMFKFGDLQVAVSPQKAYAGAAIAFIYGLLSWQISQGIQSIPESSLEYANDNALLLAKICDTEGANDFFTNCEKFVWTWKCSCQKPRWDFFFCNGFEGFSRGLYVEKWGSFVKNKEQKSMGYSLFIILRVHAHKRMSYSLFIILTRTHTFTTNSTSGILHNR